MGTATMALIEAERIGSVKDLWKPQTKTKRVKAAARYS
jgi:hypothetical protein